MENCDFARWLGCGGDFLHDLIATITADFFEVVARGWDVGWTFETMAEVRIWAAAR